VGLVPGMEYGVFGGGVPAGVGRTALSRPYARV
jgi:hypothetical protein